MNARMLAGEIRALSRVKPIRGAAALSSEVIPIVAAMALATLQPLLSPLAVLVIATRQRALAELLHAGVHRHLSDNVRLNDLLSELIAWPMGWSARAYRREHCREHAADAPPVLAIAAMMRPDDSDRPLLYHMGMLSFYAAALVLIVSQGWVGEFLVLWLLPRLLLPLLPARTRRLDAARPHAYATRYHPAHLRFPSVPWYHLPRLEGRLEDWVQDTGRALTGRGSGSAPMPISSRPRAPRQHCAHRRR